MSQYLPEVAWSTLASNVSLGPSSYRYYVTTNPLDPNEPGASTMTMIVGDWFIDYAGYPFLIEGILGSVITVYDILERGDGITSAYGPYADKVGFVYRPKNGAFLLTQAQLRKLDSSAIDIITPIEKGIIWKYRGIEIDALYGDSEVIETIAQESVNNITKLSLSPEFILRAEEDGWQGGKKYSLSLDGLLHNNLQGVQGTGLDDNYIHLDQDQVDALWTKVGNNIRRDSWVGIGKAPDTLLDVDGVGQFGEGGHRIQIGFDVGAGGGLGIYEYSGYDIAMKYSDYLGYGQWSGVTDSGLFIKDGNVGVKTNDPQDSCHIVGYARISTLAETANSSIVTSNSDGRLIKLPYDNDKGKYLRSDGTWALILTSTGDFLDSVIRMVVDSTFNPGTPTNGDRYIILNASSIHTNFGTINKFSDGSALTLGNNDIVQYYSTHSEFRIVYDSSAAMQPATVTVGTDKNGNTNHQWTYNVTDDMWIDRGAAVSHNSLDGLNDGDYKHLTATQYTNFIGLTDGSDISNTLHNHNTQYAIKQSSVTDTTSGRGMIVGAFRLGVQSPIITTSTDLDNLGTTSGVNTFFGANNSAAPVFMAGIHLQRVQSGSQRGGQIALPCDGTSPGTRGLMFRLLSNNIWGDWRTVWHDGSLVNPVTKTGSVTAGMVSYWDGTGNSQAGSADLVWDNNLKIRRDAAIRFDRTAIGFTGIEWWGTDPNQTAFKAAIRNIDSATFRRTGIGFYTSDIADWTTEAELRMSILRNGNVLIGTTTDSGYKLDVNGAIQSTGLKVGTLSGLLKASSGVVGAAVSGNDIKTVATNSILGSGNLINITISATEPSTSGKLNGDIWVES